MSSTPSGKCAAVDEETHQPRQSSSTKEPRCTIAPMRVDPYYTLPPPSTTYIQLRFQLYGFKHVYRVVQLPLSYTFANLHTLILFLFGWSGDHIHESHVYSHVEICSEDSSYPWHMQKYGRVPPPPEWISPDDERRMYFWALQHPDSAIYEVVSEGSNRHSGVRHVFHDYTYESRIEDQELTLGEVWNMRERKNASNGECTNQEMGIKYTYDLSMSWMVHITCESEAPFCSVDSPSNSPILVRAQGAPPIEDARHEIIGELDAGDKSISPLLYSQTSFELYCKGELDARARKKELAVYNVQEEYTRVQEKKRRRERRMMEQEDRFEHGSEGEDSEDDY